MKLLLIIINVITIMLLIWVQLIWARTADMLSVVQIVQLALLSDGDIPAIVALSNMAWCVCMSCFSLSLLHVVLIIFYQRRHRR